MDFPSKGGEYISLGVLISRGGLEKLNIELGELFLDLEHSVSLLEELIISQRVSPSEFIQILECTRSYFYQLLRATKFREFSGEGNTARWKIAKQLTILGSLEVFPRKDDI